MATFNNNPAIVNLFKIESAKHLLNINNTLLSSEKGGISKEMSSYMKREIHTLKGDSRMLGFHKISDAAHSMEDVFEAISNNNFELNTSVTNYILKSIDLIQNAINMLPDNEIEIEIKNISEIKETANNNNIILENKNSVVSNNTENIIENNIFENEEKILTETLKEENNLEMFENRTYEKDFDYINIRLKKVDELINLFSTFPRYTNLLTYILNDIKDFRLTLGKEVTNDSLLKRFDSIIYKFSHELNFLDITTKQFQNEISKIKIVPLSTIFDLFPRQVRDIAVETNKKVNLTVKGREVELDKGVIEKLKEILIHIISNAVVHGCESSEERIKLGKSIESKVELSAYTKGNIVIIEITDDGRGLDIERIREKAIEKRLITVENASNLSKDEIISFIFFPGFSTKELNKYSGRGIGMDVVAETLKSLNGHISVDTCENKGTTFKIALPLLSFFMPVTFVKFGKKPYAIPSSYIITTLRLDKKEIKTMTNSTEYITFDNTDIPLLSLNDIFDYSASIEEINRNILLIRCGDGIVAILTTDIILEKKIIIKKLCSLSQRFPLIIGAVLLGNEEAIPVLNIPELFRIIKEKKNIVSKYTPKKEKDHLAWAKNILIVDDSELTRKHEKRILSDYNLNIFEASNGKEALNIIENYKIDFIISDIEMPIMNGIEFIVHLKKDNNLSSIPVIVISSYKDYEIKLKELGVNYFMNKFNFDPKSLIDTLRKENIL